MNDAERELFAKSVRGGSYEDLGFPDALADDARSAVSVFFDIQGQTNGASPAFDCVRETLGTDGARLAVAHELLGAARTMLELARDHAMERVQFGRPIASFQAVRHKLAEVFVYLESADALLDDAWVAGTPEYAAMAKAFAGHAARLAAKHCQQVLAGIGFTTEHPFHLYLKRVIELDRLLGTNRELTRSLGAQLLQTKQLPPPVPL
jgi:alkylation response protein AidB-like acyl-CoA dehydrogenase